MKISLKMPVILMFITQLTNIPTSSLLTIFVRFSFFFSSINSLLFRCVSHSQHSWNDSTENIIVIVVNFALVNTLTLSQLSPYFYFVFHDDISHLLLIWMVTKICHPCFFFFLSFDHPTLNANGCSCEM